MKRFHVNVGVADLDRAVGFYTALFGSTPTVRQTDYAKWQLDDPRVNFAVTRHAAPGVNHLGVQAETEAELEELRQRLAAAELAVVDQADVVCCYARGDKTWVADPDGLAWETFLTRGQATEYADGRHADVPLAPPAAAAEACCGPSCCGP